MRWLWIDCITEHEEGKRLVAIKNVSLAEDVLHDHVVQGKTIMPFSLMIEGMAQTAGILVGSTSRFKEKVILAKISKASLDFDVTAGETIRYDATIDRIDQAGASTSGTIDRRCASGEAWERVGRVELLFSHIDNNMAGTEFPAHNFVFSANFKMVLETAGLASLAEN
ncbi:MAG: beta-hydroxyacyl-ACP dehydratase [Phycisphaerae bacterium]|nr:beta-hydroxyacyl-ACP dehydratase [Phycisphaerae bacterium]|tara:strand:+ start:5521 stop:6024 length:504 start_codon:yes stop_codon:yes gene_type:complete